MTEECERLADAIVRGGSLASAACGSARNARTELAQAPPRVVLSDPQGVERRIREKLADWRGLPMRNIETGRDVLQALLVEPLRFTPVVDEHGRGYRFTGAIALDRLVSGAIELPKTLTGDTSPAGFEPAFQP